MSPGVNKINTRAVRAVLETVRHAARHERGAARGAFDDLSIEPEGNLAFEDDEELLLPRLDVLRRAAAGSVAHVPNPMRHDRPIRCDSHSSPLTPAPCRRQR
jgi:hypothetical protein